MTCMCVYVYVCCMCSTTSFTVLLLTVRLEKFKLCQVNAALLNIILCHPHAKCSNINDSLSTFTASPYKRKIIEK